LICWKKNVDVFNVLHEFKVRLTKSKKLATQELFAALEILENGKFGRPERVCENVFSFCFINLLFYILQER